jgi:hypothetical protein
MTDGTGTHAMGWDVWKEELDCVMPFKCEDRELNIPPKYSNKEAAWWRGGDSGLDGPEATGVGAGTTVSTREELRGSTGPG